MNFFKINRTVFFFFIFFTLMFAQEDEFFIPTTTVGGYGELHYNYKKPKNFSATETLDFHRFVLFFGHSFSEKWSFKSEVELEHNLVGENNGKLELEQAYIDYHYSNNFGFKAGVLLVPVGIINEYHEPPTFFGVERPDYAKYIIPTTWFGNGVQIYGNIVGLKYIVSITEGLNADKFSAKTAIRGGRQKGFKANASSLLYSLRLDYFGFRGLNFGVSVSSNKARGEVIENSITFTEIHFQYKMKGLFITSEYGIINYTNGNVKVSSGFYTDLGYNISKILKTKTKIIPFIRYSNVNTATSVVANKEIEKQYHRIKFLFGISVKPLDTIVFKADYSTEKIELNNSSTQLFNIGIGYAF